MDLAELFDSLLKDRRVRAVRNSVPFDKKFELVDISLKDRANEDEIYKNDKQLIKDLRRGMSFIIQKDHPLQWARKGLEKFFEVKPKDFSAKDNFWERLNIISTFKLYQTTKDNGENSQVSYNESLKSWIICSKNVSLAVRSVEDILLYAGLRYNFAKLMAQTWLNILEGLSEELVSELKQELKDKTIIGEYVGNPECQHIIHYEKISIHFFALVHNYSDEIAASPELFQKFVDRYGLPCVTSAFLGCFSSKLEVLTQIQQSHPLIENASINTLNEGCVIYIANDVSTLLLCKIKTLEYKILRKMREKLKNYTESLTPDAFLKDFFAYLEKTEKKKQKSLEKYRNLAQKILLDSRLTKSTIQNSFVSLISTQAPREVFFTIGIPGLGKSYLINTLKSRFPDLTVISSDAIRSSLISPLKLSNPSLSPSQLFSRTNKAYYGVFSKAILSSSGSIYIDKNIPPSGLISLLDIFSSTPISITAFAPISKGFSLNGANWPISLEILYICLKRILQRKDHETFSLSNQAENVSVLLKMFKLYKGFTFKYYLKHGVGKVVYIDFIDENEVSVPERFRKAVEGYLGENGVKDVELGVAEEVLRSVEDGDLRFKELVINDQEQRVVFLAVFLQEFKVKPLVIASLEILAQEYADDRDLADDLRVLSNCPGESKGKLLAGSWELPETLHVTTLYIGKNAKVMHSQYYKSFIEGKAYKVLLTHLVYIPKKLVCARVEFSGESPLVANKVPHVTLMISKTPSKTSNEVLDIIDFPSGHSQRKISFGICYTLELESLEVSGISKKFLS